MSGPNGASVWFRFDGLKELIEQLRTLAPDLTAAAAPDVEAAAEQARATIYAGYPSRTGELRDHLSVSVAREDARTKATVINSSDHAILFERGTQARHTALGANRGSMPANPLFTATIVRARRRLQSGPLPRVLQLFGMRVTGA